MIEDTESFLVSIEQTIPPLTVQTGSTEVFIEDDDGMLRSTTEALAQGKLEYKSGTRPN